MKQPYKQTLPVMVDLQDNVYNAGGTSPTRGQVVNGQDKVTEYKGPATQPAIKQQIKQEQQARPQGMGGSTNDPYVAQANALYQQLMNRGPFRYDLQGDMLYRQYADQYSQLGRQAMQDTMGYASGQTGGYNSSWGQTLGQQAYQGYLTQLNSMIPDFYDRAYQAYLNEGDRLMEQYQLALQHPGYIAALQGGSGGGTVQQPEDQTTQEQNSNVLMGMSGNAIQAVLDKIKAQKNMGITTQKEFNGGPMTGMTLTPETYMSAINQAAQPDFNYFDDWYKRIVNQAIEKKTK